MSIKSKILKTVFKTIPPNFKKWVVNKKINGYGEMIEFRLDPKKRELYAKALLSGENEPIELHIQEYQLIENEENTSIVINSCITNRQWITTLVEQFIAGKEFSIPKDRFSLLKDLLSTE